MDDYGVWADRGRSAEEVWRPLLRDGRRERARSGLFDIIAHPDLVKVLGAGAPAAARRRPAPLLRAGRRSDRRSRGSRSRSRRPGCASRPARSTRPRPCSRCASKRACRSPSRATPTAPGTSAPATSRRSSCSESSASASSRSSTSAGDVGLEPIGHDGDARASAMTRHRLAAGRRLVLGGVEIPREVGLDGHCDADVLTHAVIDALLGAAGLGDIGEHFPDTDEQWRGADSIGLLRVVARGDPRRRASARQRRRTVSSRRRSSRPTRPRSAAASPCARPRPRAGQRQGHDR